MISVVKRLLTGVAVSALLIPTASFAADKVLRASHQWPGGKGDVRDEMVQMIAKEVEKANVGLKVQVYPGKALFKPKEQWGAMVNGQLDISAFPLDYASGRQRQFSATLMPGLVKNHDHAKRLNKSEFMDDIKKIIDKAGVVVVSDAWLAGGFASKKNCIRGPDSVKGQVFRAAGPAFEQMLAGAGASIASMPSSEIYTGLQTGVLDGANTSSGSFVTYRLYEQVKCLTAPGEYALWFMYEPILMSKKSFSKLNKKQQDAIMAAGQKAEDYFFEEAKKLDNKMVDVYKEKGIEVATMNEAEYKAWLDIAKKTSYKKFAENVKGGDALLEKALSVK